jgi:hypothetical protein
VAEPEPERDAPRICLGAPLACRGKASSCRAGAGRIWTRRAGLDHAPARTGAGEPEGLTGEFIICRIHPALSC